MVLLEKTAKALMNALSVEYGLRLNIEKSWTYWQERLSEAGVVEENARRIRERFVWTWEAGRRTPRLNDFARFAAAEVHKQRLLDGLAQPSELTGAEYAALREKYLPRIKAKLQRLVNAWRVDDVPEGVIPF